MTKQHTVIHGANRNGRLGTYGLLNEHFFGLRLRQQFKQNVPLRT